MKPFVRLSLLTSTVLVGLVVAGGGLPTRSTVPTLSDYEASQLGLGLGSVAEIVPVPLVESADAEAAAAAVTGQHRPADEVRRALYGAQGAVPTQPVWLVVWTGGEATGPRGPATDEARPQLVVKFTGAVIDDQTGAVITRFQTGFQQ